MAACTARRMRAQLVAMAVAHVSAAPLRFEPKALQARMIIHLAVHAIPIGPSGRRGGCQWHVGHVRLGADGAQLEVAPPEPFLEPQVADLEMFHLP
eukprot:12707078-Heterocapsa_arctica.AAC.1